MHRLIGSYELKQEGEMMKDLILQKLDINMIEFAQWVISLHNKEYKVTEEDLNNWRCKKHE